jgi:hypothetical protein
VELNVTPMYACSHVRQSVTKRKSGVQTVEKVHNLQQIDMLRHKPLFLKEINGISFRIYNTAKQLYTN